MVKVVVGPNVPYGASNCPPGEGRADPGPSRLAVRDQHGLRVPGLDGRRRVPDVQQERGAAHPGAVDPARDDAERVRDLRRSRRGDGGDPVDVPQAQPGVADRVHRRLHVQPQRGVAGQLAHLVGLGRARDDDPGAPAHGPAPAGVNTGRYTSPRGSNITRNGMSRTRASGVAGTPIRLVIIRGPSASWTTAMA